MAKALGHQASSCFFSPDDRARDPCGNGVIEGREQCDDGNRTSGDRRSSLCQLEADQDADLDSEADADEGDGGGTDVAPVDLQTCIEHAATMAHNELKYRARLVKDFAPVPQVLASDGKIA